MARVKKTKTVVELPTWRAVLIIALTAGLCVLLAVEVLTPFRKVLANRYLLRGDSYFTSQQYDQAQNEYSKALSVNPDLQEASTRRALAETAATDPAGARSFFVDHNVTPVLQRLTEAQQAFTDPKAALSEGVTLYAEGQYSYAQYSLQTAVKLDPGYSEAWNYLALTYQQLAKQNADYRQKEADAENTRDRLTSKYLTL